MQERCTARGLLPADTSGQSVVDPGGQKEGQRCKMVSGMERNCCVDQSNSVSSFLLFSTVVFCHSELSWHLVQDEMG